MLGNRQKLGKCYPFFANSNNHMKSLAAFVSDGDARGGTELPPSDCSQRLDRYYRQQRH